MGNKLTDEQKAIINSQEPVIIAKALAGTGKTSTAVEFTKARKDKKILYLVFNASMKKEAEEAFLGVSNVDIKTTHGLAYAKFGFKYKHKLAKFNYKIIDLMKDLKFEKRDYELASKIYDFNSAYLISEEREIDDFAKVYFEGKENPVSKRIVKHYKKLWELKLDVKNDTLIEHDFYFKLYYLDEFKSVNNYDILILDEAQDSNTIMKNIFNNSNCSQKLALGDDHQSIYSWRGAYNILNELNGVEYKLTNSFRIGKVSADICNALYQSLEGVKINIKGVNDNQKTFMKSNRFNPFSYDKSAIISRTNAFVLKSAIEATENNKKIYFEGGITKYKFDFYKRLYFFSRGAKQKDAILSQFEDYKDLLQYIKDTEDVELTTATTIVKMFGSKLPDYIDDIKNKAVKNKNSCDIILTTAHSSKGQTYTVPVFLTDDYLTFEDFSKMDEDIAKVKNEKHIESMKINKKEALNLIYVAITRAKDKLFVNEDISNFILKCGIIK